MPDKKEVWLRGEKTEGLAPLLQPVADALLQAEEEIEVLMNGFPDRLLLEKPAGCASASFHLLHIPGFLDRLLTYAEGKSLTEKQFDYLKKESLPYKGTTPQLVEHFKASISNTIERLKQFPESVLHKERKVGRAGLPSTIIGLCVHAAEHTTRHTGQLLVTAKVLLAQNNKL